MTDFTGYSEQSKVHEIDPAVIEKLNRLIYEKRNGKLPSNGPIDKIPRYDWKNDPNEYKDESGRIPFNRCHHCGYQYNMANGLTAFCNICTKAFKYMEGGYLTELEKRRTRVPDEKRAVDLINGNRLKI